MPLFETTIQMAQEQVFPDWKGSQESAVPASGAPPLWHATMPLPRAPHIAEREELDAALAVGTQDALEHFIERHPQSRYRDEAEAALARLRNRARENTRTQP